jgi:hypothetical protein
LLASGSLSAVTASSSALLDLGERPHPRVFPTKSAAVLLSFARPVGEIQGMSA